MQDIASQLLVKIIFPLCVIPCIYIRQSGFSFCYLILYFFIPWLNSTPSTNEMKKGFTGIFLKLALSLNGFFFVAHLVSQIAFIVVGDSTKPTRCELLEMVVRHIGIISWQDLPVVYILQDLIPEFIMLLILLSVYIRLAKMAKSLHLKINNPEREARKLFIIIAISKGGVSVLLGVVAALCPSFLGLFYLILALLVMIVWACRKRAWRKILSQPMLFFLMVLVIMHLVAIYLLQLQAVQFIAPINVLGYFDLIMITSYDCSDPRRVQYKRVKWEAYTLPIILLLLYMLTAEILYILRRSKEIRKLIDEERKQHSFDKEEKTSSDFNWTRALFDFVRTLRYMRYLDEAVTIVACLCMMLWSVLFPGYLPLVLLLWAAALCLFPQMKKRTLKSSPFLVFYAGTLYIVQYLYAIKYLETRFSHSYVKELGITFDKRRGSYLLPEILFLMTFFVLLHQYLLRRELKKKGKELEEMPVEQQRIVSAKEVPVTPFLLVLQAIRYYLVMVWIFILITLIIVVICVGDVITIFRILFLMLFILFLIVFEFSYDAWRKMWPAYCLTMGIFTLCIILIAYIDRIDSEHSLWKVLNIDQDLLLMMGAEVPEDQKDVTMILFMCVLCAVVVQIQFNEDYLSIVDIRKKLRKKLDEDASGKKPIKKKTKKKLSKVKKFEICMEKVTMFTAKYIESHGYKFLMLYLILMALDHICVLHFAMMMLAVIVLLMKHRHRYIVTRLCMVIVCAHALEWMIIHLYKYPPVEKSPDKWCTKTVTHNFQAGESEATSVSMNMMSWAGLHHSPRKGMQSVLLLHLGYLMLALLLAACSRYIQFKSFIKGEYRRYTYMIFPELTREEADYNVKNCVKFFVNYFFYKFGVEICLIAVMIMVGLRRDAVAVLYILWILFLYALNRKFLAKVWIVFICFSVISIVAQYLSLLRLPPPYCKDYPWYMHRNWRLVQDWCYFPGPFYSPLKTYLVYEIMIMILLTRQRVVFAIEKKYGSLYPGGSNEQIDEDIDDPDFVNPVPDFVTFTRSWLDIWKKIYFCSIFWVAVIIVFLAGSTEVNFWSLGYLIGSFAFFWKGEDFFLYTYQVVVNDWNIFIAFNIMVILCKVLMQFFFNMFFLYGETHTCLLLKLFSIKRQARPGGPADATSTVEETCEHHGSSNLGWDITCFTFVIIARRAFMSYYFIHIINEYKATYIISSRGAALFDQLRLREIAMREDIEQDILEEIARKMEDLRAKQKRIQENPFFVSPQSHYEAVLSGDYFFFDEKEMEEEDDKRLKKEEAKRKQKDLEAKQLTDRLATDDSEEDSSDDTYKRRMSVSEIWADTRRYKMRIAVMKARQRRGTSLHSLDTLKESEKDEDEDTKNDDSKSQGSGGEESKKKKKKCVGCIVFWYWIYEMLESAIMSCALSLYDLTKNYRYVLRELIKQKKKILATGSLHGVRDSPRSPWRPDTSDRRNSGFYSRRSTAFFLLHTSSSISFHFHMQNAAERAQFRFLKTSHQKSAFFTLLYALMYLVTANTELICYFLIILHQMLEPTMVSLLMTFAMFLIAVLSTPRPSMTFWVCLMAYTQVIVVVKCLFEFLRTSTETEKSSDHKDSVDTMALIGLEHNIQSSLLDLLLIMSILIHRYRLKKFGLWGRSSAVFTLESYPRSNVSRPNRGTSPPSLPLKTRTLLQKKEESQKFYAYYPATIVLLIAKYRQRVKKFYADIFSNVTSNKTDVYTWMFICEATCFILILAFVKHFSEMQRNWIWYFKKNRVPLSIFVMLFGQFMMMIIDRIIYVRKSVMAKLVYYYIQVVIVHCILFFFLPITIKRRVSASPVLQTFYFIKCVYFLLSAYQIRCGYSVFSHGYLFSYRYNILSWLFHFVYMLIPFFVELRNLIDWSSSDSNLTLTEWFKLEDIYNNIYDVKCQRENEKVCVKIRGKGNSVMMLCLLGGGLLLVVIVLLWLPLLIFIIRHNLGKPNLPVSLEVELSIDNYPLLYRGKSYYVRRFTAEEWSSFKIMYKYDNRALETLGYFKAEDVVLMKIATMSLQWDITDETQAHFMEDVENKATITMKMVWRIQYDYKALIVGENAKNINQGDEERPYLQTVASGGGGSVYIPYMLPKFVDTTRVDSLTKEHGESSALDGFLEYGAFRDIVLSYDDGSKVWNMTEECSGMDWEKYLKKLPEAGCDAIVVYIFSEKKFGFWLDDITSLSAQSIYLLILFTLCALVRRVWRKMLYRLHVLAIPYPDRILELCHDIYIVRLAKCFDLEEDLFAKLIFLFRSPETLIMFTRRPRHMRRQVPEDEPRDYRDDKEFNAFN